MIGLILPSFIAGFLMFLAPCTLPLVPGYLGFIAGVSLADLEDPKKRKNVKRRILQNGAMYVLGFSVVFIVLGGLLTGVVGAAFTHLRMPLARIGGGFIFLLGLYMTGVFRHIPGLRFLEQTKSLPVARHLTIGSPWSSFLFGATFALGWSPCIGPILGSILLLASTSATIWEGAFLLAIFSLGLGIPFMAIALGIGHAAQAIRRLSRILPALTIIGGLFIAFLGGLIAIGHLEIWTGWVYRAFAFINYDALLDYL
jgi:cytochrome c-type biogenesis protein